MSSGVAALLATLKERRGRLELLIFLADSSELVGASVELGDDGHLSAKCKNQSWSTKGDYAPLGPPGPP